MSSKQTKVQVKLYMRPDAHKILREQAKSEDISMSQLAEELVYGLVEPTPEKKAVDTPVD